MNLFMCGCTSTCIKKNVHTHTIYEKRSEKQKKVRERPKARESFSEIDRN